MGININKEGPNKWLLNVRVKRGAKEIRKRETFYGTQAEAQDRFLELRQGVRNGTCSRESTRVESFGDVLRIYKDKRPDISRKQESKVNALLKDLGETPLIAFPERLEKYITFLKRAPSKSSGKVLSNASINRFLTMIKTVMNLAVDLDLLDKNPITRARFPKLKEVSRDKVLPEHQKQKLLQVLRQEAPHLEAVTRYALQVPCRKSELVHMRVEDLDLFNNAIRVRNGTTKNEEGCWKPIPPDMLDYFRSIPSECPYIFYRIEKGRYWPLGDFRKTWIRGLRLAGITNFRFHDTRHISATNLLDDGTPEQVVLAVAGWKTNMLRTYYHRSGKKSLELIRFREKSGHKVDTTEDKRAENCLIYPKKGKVEG